MSAKRDTRLGAAIAERRLHVRGAPARRVVVSLGKPRKMRGSADWECPFRIEGAGIRVFERGCGVDAFQALTMALEGIRYFVDRSPEPLAWSGVTDLYTGFQRVIPLLPDGRETRRIERIVDREVRGWVKRLEQRRGRSARRVATRRPT